MIELRCDNKKHAELEISDGVISIKCSSRFCGAGSGAIIIHRWRASTGERLPDAGPFRDPVPRTKGTQQ